MENNEKNQKSSRVSEHEFFLQWGNRKRLRCVRVKDPEIAQKFKGGLRRRVTSRIDRFVVTATDKEASHLQTNRPTRKKRSRIRHSKAWSVIKVSVSLGPQSLAQNFDWNSEVKSSGSRKLSSPEKERYYTTRGSVGVDDNGKVGMGGDVEEKGLVWPKLYISLSSKEKEEDFLAMKGCKPPQRPKKRAKIIQRSLLLVSPGAWLTDMCQERYEVREKKSSNSNKRPRGLKAMGSMESDSE